MLYRLLLCLCLILPACQAFNPIGPIISLGVRWMDGVAEKYYDCPQSNLYIATKASILELGLPIVEEWQDGNTKYMKAGDDDRFKISVTAVRERISKVSIRVNLMGDKPYAELVFRHIDKKPEVTEFKSVEELNTAMDRQRRPNAKIVNEERRDRRSR